MTLYEGLLNFQTQYLNRLSDSSRRVTDPIATDWQKIVNEYSLYSEAVDRGLATEAQTHLDNIVDILAGNGIIITTPPTPPGTIDGNYTYIGYASDTSGTDFATTYNSSLHIYWALRTSTTEIASPSASDFTGLWVPMQRQYTYVAYADSNTGIGFTNTFSTDKLYFAILTSAVELLSPVQSDFTGLWQILKTKNSTFEYSTEIIEPNGLANYHTNTMGGSYNGPCAVYYKGTYNRIYFTILERYVDAAQNAISGAQTTHRVGYVDLDKNVISNLIEIPFARYHGTDTHTVPAINITNNGYIILMWEQLSGTPPAGTGHNTNIEIWRSNAAETIEDPVTPGTHYFTQTGLITGEHSYPKIFVLTDNKIFAFTRHHSGTHKYAAGFKSEDDGVTWTSLTGVTNSYTDIINYDRTGPTDWYTYIYTVDGAQGYGINLFLCPNEGFTGTSPDGTPASSNAKTLYFLHSDNGTNWDNAELFTIGSGGTTKNIISSGALTYAELEANYKVDDVSTDVEYSMQILHTSLKETDGIPYILYMINDRTPESGGNAPIINNTGVYLYIAYYDTGTTSWVKTDVLSMLQLESTSVYGVGLYYGGLGAIKVYNENIIDVMLTRIKYFPYGRAYSEISSTSDIVDGKQYRITATDVNHFGTGAVVDDILYVFGSGGNHITATGTIITLDANNKLEPLLLEKVYFRTYDAGSNWSIIKVDDDLNHIGYTGFYTSHDFGQEANYTAFFHLITEPYDGSKAADKSNLKIIIGKRI